MKKVVLAQSSSSSSSSASAKGAFGGSFTTSTSECPSDAEEMKNSKWEGNREDQQVSEMASAALRTAEKRTGEPQWQTDETVEKQKPEPEGDGDVNSAALAGSEAFHECESATTFTNTYTSPRMPIMSPGEDDFNNSSVHEDDVQTPRHDVEQVPPSEKAVADTNAEKKETPAAPAAAAAAEETPPSSKGMTEDDVKGLLHGLLADSQKRRASRSGSSTTSQPKEELFTPHAVETTPEKRKSISVEEGETSLVAPSISTMTTEQHDVSVATSGRKRRADSAQWVAMRQEELAGLRAELEQRMAADPTPRRHSASNSPSRVETAPSEEPSVVVAVPPLAEDVSVDAHADHTEPHVSVDDVASSVEERDVEDAASETETGMTPIYRSEVRTTLPVAASAPVVPTTTTTTATTTARSTAQPTAVDGTSPLQPTTTASSSTLAQNDTFRPNWSSISNISPDKNDIHSIIVALYGASPPLTTNMRPSLPRAAETEEEADASTFLESTPTRTRLNYSTSRDARTTSANTSQRAPGFTSSVQQDRKMWKQQKIREEMKAKEFAECTFHPTISPGTRAMLDIQQHSKIEEMNSGARAKKTDSSNTRKSPFPEEKASAATMLKVERRDLLQSVYDRLYPAKLAEASRQRERIEQEMEYKKECRREMRDIREKCGALFLAETTETAFKVFLSNVMMYDCRTATRRTLTEEGVYVDTTYRSPMAVAMLEETASKKRLAAQRRNEVDAFCQEDVNASTSGVAGAGAGGGKSAEDTSKRDFHITLFDDFLLRQNAFYKRRQQKLQDLTQSLTPDFTPSVSDQSTSIVKELVSRSTANATLDEKKAELRKKHIPVSGSMVKKRPSAYHDECSFHPEISQHAKEKHGPTSSGSGHNVNDSYIGSQGRNRHTGLYEDYKRMKNSRAAAQKKKEEAELDGYTFKPTNLNDKKNAGVQSMLAEKNYDAYNKYLQRRKGQRLAQARTEAEVVENEEVHLCTFRPKTSKTPSYVSKMASDFGVLRNQDVEF